ncbi:NAD(P)/FAD-dependent oxidoreductase [Actinobacteria bacterium YIM 96077]|uniref:FAD-dependent oxidoreductase n=1 Tax=Phytoactinopolyspora halophila TaxID=1981511 RepID=A0A329R3E4_9ACTN|nr:NAD(P)/FAD-dependent oxidoreductase [Phytoactinopolyspora halophila]AYY13275.1 NAD(P)/FAD-dependent oxidoreductase [Actinobacteria bacterium YIM 96077]RAW17488.1 FAD-dependent oxidoreductase [Phytoactinopolyspora halophila]
MSRIGSRAVHHAPRLSSRYDAVVIGGGHNGLTAAAYLADAGYSVLVLERLDQAGGAAVSTHPFRGVDARVSRYAYLVSLLPRQIVDELALPITLRQRRSASYTPTGHTGLLVDTDDGLDGTARTAASFADVTGSAGEYATWNDFHSRIAHAAARIFPTMTQPLISRESMRRLVDDDETWRMLVDEPIGHTVTTAFGDDAVRGVVLTDALIGTFTDVHDTSLLANRCFLYHVVGNGTGDWDVPVGGMGAVSEALEHAARARGAAIHTGAVVTAVDPDGEVSFVDADGITHRVGAGHILAGCAPATLARLLGEEPGTAPEGAQLKVNMLLRRLPRLRSGADPELAFGGTLHVNERSSQLRAAFAWARAGTIPHPAPCDVYCHSLTDDSVLGPSLRADGAHALTVFGLHMPARLFRDDNDAAREYATRAVLASLDSVLAEPIEDCLYTDVDGRACLEAHTPVDLEHELGLPGGHIFHGDLSWPFVEHEDEAGRWGVETEHARVLLCGAGARRGGGVSGIPGRAAAMAVLGK